MWILDKSIGLSQNNIDAKLKQLLLTESNTKRLNHISHCRLLGLVSKFLFPYTESVINPYHVCLSYLHIIFKQTLLDEIIIFFHFFYNM